MQAAAPLAVSRGRWVQHETLPVAAPVARHPSSADPGQHHAVRDDAWGGAERSCEAVQDEVGSQERRPPPWDLPGAQRGDDDVPAPIRPSAQLCGG